MTLLLTKNLYFTKKFLHLTFFLVTSYFSRAFLNTTSANIGGTDAWASVPPSLQFPPKSPPMAKTISHVLFILYAGFLSVRVSASSCQTLGTKNLQIILLTFHDYTLQFC